MKSIVVTEDQLLLVKELDELRHQAKALDKRADEIRGALLEVLDAEGAQRGLTAAGIPAVVLGEQSRRQVNPRRLEALYPDVFVDVVETKIVRTLTVTL